MRGFGVYNCVRADCLRPSGGASVFVRSSFPQGGIDLQTQLRAAAVSVTLDREVAMCSVYVPPSFSLNSQHLDGLLQQLPSPYIMLGDFGGRSVLWGGRNNDSGGGLIEDFLTRGDICVMNDGSYTCLSTGAKSFSSVDLSFCHPSLFLGCSWSVGGDRHSSDRFPIIIERSTFSTEDHSPEWKLDGANWDLFGALCTGELVPEGFGESSGPISDFASSLVEVSRECIPRASTGPAGGDPWCNDDCEEAVEQRKRALSGFKRSPSSSSLDDVKVFGARARGTVELSKRGSWRSCVSKINHETPIGGVWDVMGGISGRSRSPSCTHLSMVGADSKAASGADIADTLGGAFCRSSSSFRCSGSFRGIGAEQEKVGLSFESQNSEVCDKDFNLDELVEAVQLSRGSAAGPDGIHYRMLGRLPESSLEALLNIFNYIWTTGGFPEDWTLAAMVPVPGPGKDPAEPGGYGPVALTGCLCGALEGVVNKRLAWFLESSGRVSRFQSGFRSGRGTTDNLVGLEAFMRDAFVKEERVVAVFFGLEGACGAAWRCGILGDIHKLGLGGGLPAFVEDFLADRAVRVRVGSSLSGCCDQEQGVPQGGVLSAALFSIKIDDIVGCLGGLADCSLCVDDFCICCRSGSVATIGRRLQQGLGKIENWATGGGFGFSRSGARCVRFCQLRGRRGGPVLHLCGSPVPVVGGSEFLGVLFDRRLSFVSHIKCLKAGCLGALSLLGVLSHASWGAGRAALLKLCRSLVRSRLDYGCIVYGSARGSCLQMLGPVHGQGLGLALGAFGTSPVAGLCVEADEPSLCSRRGRLSLQCAIGLAASPSDPAHEVAFPPGCVDLYEQEPEAVESFGVGVSPLLESANIKPQGVEKHFTPSVPAWCVKPPEILFDLHSGRESESNPHILEDDFRKMQGRCGNYQQVCADGSKEDSRVGCAVVSDSHGDMQRVPGDSSIFTAEAGAVDLALDFISTCDADNGFVIFSDSLSVLKAMNRASSGNPQIRKLLEKCHGLLAYKEIALCWIPSRVGVQGSEMVDKQAKASLSLEPTSFKVPFSNFKPSINEYILEEWQTSWNGGIGNELLDIRPTIGEYQSVVRGIRGEEVVLARLRLGHTRVTHSYLLQGEEQPQCVGCDAPFTVRHFLLECGDFAQVRNNCFHVDNMKELFQDIHIDSIMTFLRQINLFNKI